MKRIVIVFAAVYIAVLACVLLATWSLATPQNVMAKQKWVCWHHVAQGQGDQSWTKCMPDDQVAGHLGHAGDGYATTCTDCGEETNTPTATSTVPAPPENTATPTATSTQVSPPPANTATPTATSTQVLPPEATATPTATGTPPVIPPTPIPPQVFPPIPYGSAQFWIDPTNLPSGMVAEIYPGKNVIHYDKNGHPMYALEVAPGNALVPGTASCQGPDGNVTAYWYTVGTWDGSRGFVPLLQIRSPKCQPAADLVITVDASGVHAPYVPGWEVVTVPAGSQVQYFFH